MCGEYIWLSQNSLCINSDLRKMITFSLVNLRVGRRVLPFIRRRRCISRMCAKSLGSLAAATIVARHSSIISRIRRCARDGRGGGRSGNRRTNSFRKSFVAICRWKGYPQFLTHISSNYSPVRHDKGDVLRWERGLQHVGLVSWRVELSRLQLHVDCH